jgi:hypothetical protein
MKVGEYHQTIGVPHRLMPGSFQQINSLLLQLFLFWPYA